VKLIRFGEPGAERPGVLEGGVRRDVSQLCPDFNRDFFQSGGVARLAAALKNQPPLPVVPEGARWGACVARPGKVVCVGLNYSDHAKESGAQVPAEPVLFLKGTNTVVGPFDNVLIPRKSEKTDWEVELGVIIGQEARYLESPEAALDYIAGYTISHDVSEREFQMERSGQWTKGKSCDTFNPLGPFLATPDEIPSSADLALELWVNGERRQNGNTKTMVFDVPFLVHYISQFMTLEAGDVISTGTPPGVGLGMKPPTYLKPGDIVELAITGLGRQRQIFRPA
jgi:2,4-didehydro-3-deoxy-L-rhamnonate hydrolase